jgi:hypothetical protein
MLCLLASLDMFGRPMQSPNMKTLITKSELVFVGRVRSVQPSGVTTSLTYATWGAVAFGWLAVEVEVLGHSSGRRCPHLHVVHEPARNN